MAARSWTPQQRRQQAERIRTQRPWERSTGPRTDEGKAAAARNAWKGGTRPTLLMLARLLRDQRESLAEAPATAQRAPDRCRA